MRCGDSGSSTKARAESKSEMSPNSSVPKRRSHFMPVRLPCTSARPRNTPFSISLASSVTSAVGYFSTSVCSADLNDATLPDCT